MSEADNRVVSSVTSISVGEYLATSYRPDRDYVDGEVRERNFGEWEHSWVQANLVSYFIQRRESFGLRAVTEQRVQVKATRFRVPDVCVVRSNPRQQILTQPPFLCVEVLSPEDSLSSIKDRIEDYLAFGVENIWIVDPQTKRLYWADAYGTHEAPDSVLETRNPSVRVDFNEIWPE
jgi:Uma2 family endonuclease